MHVSHPRHPLSHKLPEIFRPPWLCVRATGPPPAVAAYGHRHGALRMMMVSPAPLPASHCRTILLPHSMPMRICTRAAFLPRGRQAKVILVERRAGELQRELDRTRMEMSEHLRMAERRVAEAERRTQQVCEPWRTMRVLLCQGPCGGELQGRPCVVLKTLCASPIHALVGVVGSVRGQARRTLPWQAWQAGRQSSRSSSNAAGGLARGVAWSCVGHVFAASLLASDTLGTSGPRLRARPLTSPHCCVAAGQGGPRRDGAGAGWQAKPAGAQVRGGLRQGGGAGGEGAEAPSTSLPAGHTPEPVQVRYMSGCLDLPLPLKQHKCTFTGASRLEAHTDHARMLHVRCPLGPTHV